MNPNSSRRSIEITPKEEGWGRLFNSISNKILNEFKSINIICLLVK